MKKKLSKLLLILIAIIISIVILRIMRVLPIEITEKEDYGNLVVNVTFIEELKRPMVIMDKEYAENCTFNETEYEYFIECDLINSTKELKQ